MNKKVLIPVVMGAYLCLSPLSVKAEDYYKWDSKVTADKNKIWTIKLSKKLNNNISGIKDKVYIKDSKGNKLDCNVKIKPNEKILEVLPPKDGYKEKENYYLYIDKSIPSDKNKNLKETVKMNFYIDGYIEFEDKNLEEEVRKVANPKDRPKGPLTYMDVSGIKELNVHNKNIKSLKGIEYLKNITKLDISDNNIKDISYLKGLNRLELLNLYNNNIEYISPINNMKKLKDINLSKNNVKDISYLKDLNLHHLDLRDNKIENIEVLRNKISLQHLYLANNSIKDFSPISNLKNLQILYLSHNYSSNYDYAKDYYNNLKDRDFKLNVPIEFKDKVFEELVRKEINKPSGYIYPTDLENIKELDFHNAHIEKLNGIENMTALEKLNLSGTDIKDISLLKCLINLKEVNISNTSISDITALKNSIYIRYLNLNETNVTTLQVIEKFQYIERLYVSGTKINTVPQLSSLLELDLSNCNINDISFINYLHNLTYLNVGKLKYRSNILGNISFVSSLEKLEYLSIANTDVVNIDVLRNLINLRKLDITGCAQINTQVLNHVEIIGNEIVNFGDKVLEREIRELINNYSEPIYKRQLSSITKLELSGRGIVDLQGLESMENLTYLDLSNNEISNIDSIKKLVNLKKLVLHKNKIGSIKSIESLKYLEELDLSNNLIGDITALGGLSQLTRLDLSKNGIVSINSLGSLINLQYLSLYENKISEGEEYLKKLYSLRELYLKNSGVSNFDVTLAYYNNLEKKDFTTNSDFIVFDEKLDSDLAKIIREILGKDENTNIYKSEVDTITDLNLSEEAISRLNISSRLTNTNVINLDGIQYFSNLHSINLRGHGKLEGLENLMPIRGLIKLDLQGREINYTSLYYIKYLTSLRYLYLNNMNLTGDLSFLENLTDLMVLDLSRTGISNISILDKLRNLSELYLGGNNIIDLSSLENLTNLVKLDLVENNDITSIYALRNLINLRYLTLPITNPKKIQDYSAVASYYYNLTYKNFDLKDSNAIVIKEIRPIEKEVNKGDKFTLPDYVEATMSDNSKGKFKVHWKEKSVDTSKSGIYTYIGTVDGYTGEVKLTLRINGEIPYGMGNSSSNILNGGFIIKDSEYIYYINKESGNGKIYRNKINGAEDKLLSSNAAEFLNIYGEYIYYVSNGNIYRIRKDGSEEKLIKEASASYMTVCNDFIYYFDKSKTGIYKVKIDGTSYSSVVSGGKWRLDSQFVISGEWIYYTNYEDKSSIYKIKIDGTGKEKLNNIPCSQMSVIGSSIYYVSNGNLYKISIDGSNNSLVYSGNVANINVYSNHIYYIDNNDNETLYKMNLDGSYRVKLTKKSVKYISILEGEIYYIPSDNEDKISKFYEE
ncbi:leucine-rich repeat domain-containing protein [Clostridium botulinum]|uniref:leucine-rich repeat domain-containing protein n=1 Tax=Clostridium botulinum TaxID=1491 RepID=UPI001C9BA930|nr:leucine-rich repeat domain-containing protein [Clostridium botulinum]MBY6756567.1 leucine-rich repeat domain-containing protein [Clostridium botulinum]